jgi:hypothetical protein
VRDGENLVDNLEVARPVPQHDHVSRRQRIATGAASRFSEQKH